MNYYLVSVRMIDAIRSLLCKAEVPFVNGDSDGITDSDVYMLLLDAVRNSPMYTIPMDFAKAEAAEYEFETNPFWPEEKMANLNEMRERRAKIAELLERIPKDDLEIVEDVTMIRKGLMIWDALLALNISEQTKKEAATCK